MKNEWTKRASTYVVSTLVGGYEAFVLMLMWNWFVSLVVRQIVAPAMGIEPTSEASQPLGTWLNGRLLVRLPDHEMAG